MMARALVAISWLWGWVHYNRHGRAKEWKGPGSLMIFEVTTQLWEDYLWSYFLWEKNKPWGWDPHNGINGLIRRNARELSPCSFLHYVRIQWEGGCVQVGKRVLTGYWICQDLNPGLPASSMVRNKCLFKPLGLWYFVIPAEMIKTEMQEEENLNTDWHKLQCLKGFRCFGEPRKGTACCICPSWVPKAWGVFSYRRKG